jgi:N-acetylmuramoyl-L-alanine amidase
VAKTSQKLHRTISVLGLIVGLSLITAFVGVSYSNSITPTGIIIHHSALPLPPEAVDARLIDQIHRKRGFSAFYWGRFYHIGYHYIILPNGTIQEGRPEHCRGAHAEGYNSYIGICLVGNFSSEANPNGKFGPAEPTAAQLDALMRLCRELRKKYHFSLEQIRRHSDTNPTTECPGDRFPFSALLKALRDEEPQR